MMTCEEAKQALYELETSRSKNVTPLDAATMMALAKAHLSVCMACSEYFDRERRFITAFHNRLSLINPPIAQPRVREIIEAAMRSPTELPPKSATPESGFWNFLRRLFRQ